MANNMKSIRIVSVLVCALVISLALVLYGTLSQLQDSKTATGTVTFNLADYDLVLHTSTSGVLAAPGQVGKTNIVQLINTYATGTDGNTGTTAGMGPLYIKMVITSVTVGSEPVSLSLSQGSNTIASNSNFTIALNTDADLDSTNESLTWTSKSDGIYLTKVGGGAPLPFSESQTNYANAADIQFNITMKDPNVNNGFNASGSTTVNNNKYQGQTVKINYTLYWATTEAGLSSTQQQ